MAADGLFLRDAIGSFAPGQTFRAVLLLTYSFDGAWLEEGFIRDLFDRRVETALVIRDRWAVIKEANNHRYHRVNAAHSKRTFHSKLGLFVAEDRALAFIGSANLTRGGLERNLELGAVFEISPEGGPRSLFRSLLEYIAGPLKQEVRGALETADIDNTVVALQEVLQRTPREKQVRHKLLHNYQRSLWDQVLESLPHRHVAKVVIVSPFFEPDRQPAEDPVVHHGDEGAFARLFTDLTLSPTKGERAVSVFFQESGGNTDLPIDKLKAWKHQIDLRQRSWAGEDARPLHAKMLMIEGNQDLRREPYLVTVFGSPNFTTAAFLSRPPDGNAEIAVLTHLPPKRNGVYRISKALRLDTLFSDVKDWATLRNIVSPRSPIPGMNEFRINQASFRIQDHMLIVSWEGSTSGAAEIRIRADVNGAMITVASLPLGTESKAELEVPNFLHTDKTGLSSMITTHIRVDLVDAAGTVIASSDAPLNVDRPEQFCGCDMVGPLVVTLDQQIAFGGHAVPLTYSEQLKFLELYRSRSSELKVGGKLSVLTHQADLDRFFRNLHTGFRRIRREASNGSVYTLRYSLQSISRWLREMFALPDDTMTNERRIYLADRLGSTLQDILEQSCSKNKLVAAKVGDALREFEVHSALRVAIERLKSIDDKFLSRYLKTTIGRLKAAIQTVTKVEERHGGKRKGRRGTALGARAGA